MSTLHIDMAKVPSDIGIRELTKDEKDLQLKYLKKIN